MELMTNNPAMAETRNNLQAEHPFRVSQQATELPVQKKMLAVPPSSLELHRTAARVRLELAKTSDDRRHAVAAAVDLGMPLWEIEQYLDWLDVSHAYRATASGAPTWVNRFFNGMNPVRRGIEALRRVGRRLFDSADPA